MSERKMGFRFNAQNHCSPANSHIGQQKPELEHVKKPASSHEHSTTNGGGRRFGFPSSMFQRGDKNTAWTDPTVSSEGGWVRPSQTGWTLPPDEPLEPAVKNAYTSADNIRRSPAFPAGGGGMFGRGSGQAFPAMKKATGLENIDSNEAAKKYGGRFMF
ncbi:hypothetical protein IEQ34_005005 [Dendrobium chrysotoxum]|uniref:Uncharacterized protein n=1 Tax=Dendrobium chrysotoxum TaxID=161865 RepID=A0AAV7H8W9_DENCH|nr:hypothetical protein IEQ34_005005 [Dendrobium chrysotoxum]